MQTPQPALPPEPAAPPEAEVLQTLALLGRRRLRLLGWPLAAAVLAVAVSFLVPRTYTATARLMPPQQSQGTAAALISQMVGSLPAAASSAIGLKNPSDLYVGILKSTSVADALVTRFDLLKVYDREYRVDARRDLAHDSDVTTDKTGIITIEVEATDPARAAALANGYVEELRRLTDSLAISEASRKRVYLEQQLEVARQKLEDSEAKLRKAIGAGGLVSVDAQSRATVETMERLRAQISASEIDLRAMQAYAAPDHPDLVRAREGVASMRRELARLESGIPSGVKEALSREAPGGLSSIRLLRDVKYNEALFEAIAKSYELARADEGQDAVLVQAMDPARPPEKPSGPRRLLIAVLAALVGGAAAVGVTLLQERLRRPGVQEQVDVALDAWGLRGRWLRWPWRRKA